ncbi:MAG TPA: PAS domain S-box protein, partial [Clostridia bacterium]|nr:PAS domain S-box protein [Clostridia bacterium]
DRERVAKVLQEAKQGGLSHIEYRILRPDGNIRWISDFGFAIHDERGLVRSVGRVARDITERKRVEEGQAMLAAIVQYSSEAIISDTVEGVITSWNAGAEKLFGYKAQEVIGRHESLLMPTGRTQELHEDLERVKRGEVVRRQEIELVCKNGQSIVVSWAVSPIWDHNGRVIRAAKIVHDVTGLKLAEEALRRSEAIYHAMARSIPEGAMSVVDTNLRYLLVEGVLLERLGLIKDAMVGHTVQEVLEGEIGQERVGYFRRALAGEVTSYEAEYRGCIVWSQFVPLREQDGRVMAAMSLAIDVTERRRAEEALRSKSERLRLLSEAAGELLSGQAPELAVRELFGRLAPHLDLEVYFIFRVDDSGRALRLDSWAGVSDEVARQIGRLAMEQAVCGTVAQEHQAVVLHDVQHSQDPRTELLRALGLQAYGCFPLLAGERLVGTLSFGSRQRQKFSPEEVELLRTVSFYVSVAREQAQHRRHLERTVEERTAKLREMVSELEHVSYSMVHDMRAPLRAIQGFADLIERGEGERLSPVSRELLLKLGGSIHHMDKLITDVLNYNKAVRSRLPMGTVGLKRLLRRLLEINPELQPPHAEVMLAGELPQVLANEAGLAQSLAELLRNAVKFVESGKLPQVKVWAERINNPMGWVRVYVEDNGTGIPTDWQNRIFDLFQRMHGADYPGTGIGLALVRKLVERMGGHMGVESEPGRGSRFWVELREA